MSARKIEEPLPAWMEEIRGRVRSGRCAAIRRQDCTNPATGVDHLCKSCRKEYDDFCAHRDLTHMPTEHEIEPSAARWGGGFHREWSGAHSPDYDRPEEK